MKNKTAGIDWTLSKEDALLVQQIAKRAVKLAKAQGVNYDQVTTFMDLNACHSNGCALRLADLLAADDGNFAHDVFGINRHIDRETGKLLDCFLPRYAAPQARCANMTNKTNTQAHTPGEWSKPHALIGTDAYRINDRFGRCIAQTYGENREANARLIAAAPDLLAVLERAESFIDGVIADGAHDSIKSLRDDCRAAIAKATPHAPEKVYVIARPQLDSWVYLLSASGKRREFASGSAAESFLARIYPNRPAQSDQREGYFVMEVR